MLKASRALRGMLLSPDCVLYTNEIKNLKCYALDADGVRRRTFH